ncbi:hypothetical protein ORJ04_05070 [Rheinheimera baltica]|uniref:MSHA biogenesis protein MshK n=1 Tax=Rheinheimera baltica TaxID=67576 RepID=A0ABT9HW17_9GAMM|nr:hypothetical protein [Rheinheimera baltica]MDP5135322.1 hypothetical protein [Rheinheimera baltica]MDP5142593.1 hypothetical protein [Rheinheimera baltica]MDP5151902.1 hypothetical protein [Rheinheimera baltica]
MKTLSVCSLCTLFSVAVLADPTRPVAGWQSDTELSEAQVHAALPQLQLIKSTINGYVALIDGVLVHKGGYYKQQRVLDIQDTQVTLELNGVQQVLPLLNTAIKQYEE